MPVVIADFDQDGWLDIAAALDDSVAVLVNDGNWSPLPIGDGPRPSAPLDVDTEDSLHPITTQTQTLSRSTISPVDDDATAIAIRPKYVSRNIARNAHTETINGVFDVLSTELI